MSDHRREEVPEELGLVPDCAVSAVEICDERNTVNSASNCGPPRHQFTPTLRRVSLLNTLLFLGLALSNTKLHARASPSNGVNTQSSPVQTQPTIHAQGTSDSEHSASIVVVDPENSVELNAAPAEEEETPLDSLLEVIDDEDEDEPCQTAEEEPSDDSSHETREGVIIVATVDGTLAAVEGSTGRVLWKKAGKESKIHIAKNKDDNHDDGLKIPSEHSSGSKIPKLLHPLTTTTTTVSSTSDASIMAAIPSINGKVFLTTVDATNDLKTTPNAMTRTETASLKELVARAPYVDSSGRFYVGSRHTTAAAIDSKTGEILYVASAHGNDDEGSMNSDPEWEGRSVVWLGRVDYSVSVFNAKSSSREVQFSASELMSVKDMVADKGKPRKSQHDPTALSTTSERAPNLLVLPEDNLFQGSAFFDDVDEEQPDASLVATPSGNLAYRNQDGSVQWVADEAFETPIAYAVHSSSGQSLDVDIIPDVTMPSHSKEYLTREIERQIELTLGSGSDVPHENTEAGEDHSVQEMDAMQPSIVGTVLNGQLYSMPLGGRHQSTLPRHSTLATTRAQQHHVTLDIGAVQRHHSAASLSSLAPFHEKHVLASKMPLPVGRLPQAHDERQIAANRACGPSSPVFPGCLFKAVSQRVVGSLNAVSSLKSKKAPAVRGNSDEVGQYLPSAELGAVGTFQQESDQDTPYYNDHDYKFNQQQNGQRNYRKILKILGSWLPPTIALLFVVSFELGRRKRQKDSLDVLKQVANSNAVEANELLRSVNQKGEISDNSSPGQMIQITDEVLGFGGHGTVVFRGTLEGRNVAVKRMLKTYLASADREISLLIESDGHPNVVRYFLKEVKGDFVYLALELCDMSLHTLIGTLVAMPAHPQSQCISNAMRRLLLQIATGVKHLHSLRIVHRDLKPANILLAASREAKTDKGGLSKEAIYSTFQREQYVAKISDMGLGKLLAGQSSFGASASFRGQSSAVNSNGNGGMGPGTVGWMAPETMRMKSITPSIASEASNNSGDASPLEKAVSSSTRESRSVDIFSLGCIFYSTLVPGLHPFGEWYEREANIMHSRPSIEPLKKLSVEAYNLVAAMIQNSPRIRPTARQICEHPFFWSLQRKLSFVCDLSDRLETDAALSDNEKHASGFSAHPLVIEKNAARVVGLTWDKALYTGLTQQRYRTYDPSSVRDLLRLLRNKKNHFQDLDASVRQKIGSNADGLMEYFGSCFPELLMHCYKVCCEVLAPDDPLMEKYLMTAASYPVVNTILPTQPRTKVPPDTTTLNTVTKLEAIEEPQFASQETLSQCGETSFTEEATINQSNSQVPSDDPPKLDAVESHERSGTTKEAQECHSPTSLQLPPSQEQITRDETIESIEKTISEGHGESLQDDVVLWEGSTAARTLNCRGWIRSEDEWGRGCGTRKRNTILVRCAEDPKFRTRLCNHWDTSMGTFCPMRKKNKCVFAHGPVELRVKEGKKGRWGKLVDKNGNNSNPCNSGGEDTYGAARSIESARKEEGKWSSRKEPNGAKNGTKKPNSNKKRVK